MTDMQRNWAGNQRFSAARWHHPETVEQVQALVRRARRLRVVGSRHSFNTIADSPEDMLSLERFAPQVTLDRTRQTVTVNAGMRYGDLARVLQAEGCALHNLASLPHISVAGACATATHGSGDANGSLATAVSALELVTAAGERVNLSRAMGANFYGAVVGLGALGVVTSLTLDVMPAFEVRQSIYENLPLAELAAHFDEISSGGYSVSLFTDWQSASFNQVWIKRLAEGAAAAPAAEFFGARLATRPRHPIEALSAENCTEQMGVAGAWHERLPHFRLEFTPSSGEELQSEYFVPRAAAVAAIRAVDALREQVAPLLLVSEIRTVAADELWLSPCYQQASVTLHFTWKPDWPAVRQVLPRIEAALAPFNARPHWGKLFTLPPARLQALYPRLPDFRRLMHDYDPDGKFRNDFVNTYLFDEA